MTSRLHAYTIKRLMRIVVSVLLLIAFTGLLSWLTVRAFTIQNIVVDAPLMSIELDKKRFGKNLLFLPTAKLREELLKNYSLLSDVRFEKKYPGTLIVHLIRRETFAVLVSEGVSYAIDDRGLVLGGTESNETRYPVLTFRCGALAIGSTVPCQGVRASLTFLHNLEVSEYPTRMQEKDSLSIHAIRGDTNIFLPQTGDLGAKADTLQTITEGFRIKGTLPTVIDLRFEKPIITN